LLCCGTHVEHDVETCTLTSGSSVEQNVGTCGLTSVPRASSLGDSSSYEQF
ncbi:hypothetical protein A2U01_0094908, partial [Trifolium medium]|nr:hypothetical protein [Trifolium medium]